MITPTVVPVHDLPTAHPSLWIALPSGGRKRAVLVQS